jgi:murein DD-endopeptidase MepM/ murein hydrolase activator NlpD
LGLVVAGAVGLTTEAQTTDSELSGLPETSTSVAVPAKQAADDQSSSKTKFPAFAKREVPTTDRPARSVALREALVNEHAAQRNELLAKTADEVSRAAEAASGDARQKELTAVDRASRKAAAQIAAENLRRAIAARVAAAQRRQNVERKPSDKAAPSNAYRAGSDSGSGSGRGDSGRSSGSDGSGSSSSSGGGTRAAASPVPGAVIGSHFGEYGSWSRHHTGIDFRAGHGTPIRAVKAGVVLYAGNSGNWAGNHVAIKHADGMTTMYSHMSSTGVTAGESVQAGQIIGRVGQTGRAFGAHLHFELYPAGVKYGDVYKAINPQPWLKANGVTTH